MKNLIAHVKDTDTARTLFSPNYNYWFQKDSGVFARWGKSFEDDPAFSPFGPEILDLEISTGECLGNCKFCYKCNGSGESTENMLLATFDAIIDKFPHAKQGDISVPILTQIAFGITNIGSNPDFFPIMRRAKERGIIPNYTCHGLDVTKEVAKETAELCGAVAVSIVNKEKTYDAVKMFSDAGMKQVNIHFMLAEETYDKAMEIVDDIVTDSRLKGLKAIVFLQYKSKGRNTDQFHCIPSVDDYKRLIAHCEDKKVAFGFDSCSAPLFLQSIKDRPEAESFIQMAEPCESFGMFSSYINVKGEYFPCSFAEGEEDWEEGINVLECDSFLSDVWFSEKINKWREIMIHSSESCDCDMAKHCRSCPIFDITACKNTSEVLI